MSPDVMELQTALQKEFKQPVFLFVLPTSYLLQFNDLRKVNVPLDFKKADIQKIVDTLIEKKVEVKKKVKRKSTKVAKDESKPKDNLLTKKKNDG